MKKNKSLFLLCLFVVFASLFAACSPEINSEPSELKILEAFYASPEDPATLFSEVERLQTVYYDECYELVINTDNTFAKPKKAFVYEDGQKVATVNVKSTSTIAIVYRNMERKEGDPDSKDLSVSVVMEDDLGRKTEPYNFKVTLKNLEPSSLKLKEVFYSLEEPTTDTLSTVKREFNQKFGEDYYLIIDFAEPDKNVTKALLYIDNKLSTTYLLDAVYEFQFSTFDKVYWTTPSDYDGKTKYSLMLDFVLVDSDGKRSNHLRFPITIQGIKG